MNKLGVPESSRPILDILKAAGAVGLLIGIGMPVIGTAAAAGLTVFLVGAVITHLRARDYSLGRGEPVMFLLLTVAALVLGVYGRTATVSREHKTMTLGPVLQIVGERPSAHRS
jgi:hypothetical protein